MTKRLALAAVVLGTGGLLAVAPAQAADVCVSYDITVNDEQQAGEVCLPPEGAPAPELPELPAPPALR